MKPTESPGEEPVPAALRKHFSLHNWHVLFLAGATLLVAAASWGLLGFGLYWIALLALTATEGGTAAVPASFLKIFGLTAGAVCLLLWAVRRGRPDARPRDRTPALTVAIDLLLVLPRATLAVWDTLTAFQWLRTKELVLAWQLLRCVEGDRGFPLHRVALEVPDFATREKILAALQITGLIEVKRRGDDFILTLADEGRAICQRKVRIGRPPAGLTWQ